MFHATIGPSKVLSGGPACGTVDIRPLTESHLGDFERLLQSLDRDARCARFGYAASDARLAAHAKAAMTNARGVHGAFCGSELLGLSESYDTGALGTLGSSHEVALAVAEPWRRCGLGWRLLHGAMEHAREAQARSVQLLFGRHDWPMRRLATRACARFDLSFDIIVARIELDAPAERPTESP